jgi:hypothetical protein
MRRQHDRDGLDSRKPTLPSTLNLLPPNKPMTDGSINNRPRTRLAIATLLRISAMRGGRLRPSAKKFDVASSVTLWHLFLIGDCWITDMADPGEALHLDRATSRTDSSAYLRGKVVVMGEKVNGMYESRLFVLCW